MNKKIVGIIVALIIVGGGAFYGGTVYAKNQVPTRGTFGGTTGVAGRTGGRTGGGFTSGQIISSANGSVTIQEPSGSTEIVLVSSSTSILKSTSGSLSDLAPGANVTVTGTSNSDGSLTAQSIQIRPAGANAPMIPAGGTGGTNASASVTQ
jgi:Domain of unknown function (DUF5666)